MMFVRKKLDRKPCPYPSFPTTLSLFLTRSLRICRIATLSAIILEYFIFEIWKEGRTGIGTMIMRTKSVRSNLCSDVITQTRS